MFWKPNYILYFIQFFFLGGGVLWKSSHSIVNHSYLQTLQLSILLDIRSCFSSIWLCSNYVFVFIYSPIYELRKLLYQLRIHSFINICLIVLFSDHQDEFNFFLPFVFLLLHFNIISRLAKDSTAIHVILADLLNNILQLISDFYFK